MRTDVAPPPRTGIGILDKCGQYFAGFVMTGGERHRSGRIGWLRAAVLGWWPGLPDSRLARSPWQPASMYP